MAKHKRPISFYLIAAFLASTVVFAAGIGLGLLIDEIKSASLSSSISSLQNSIVDAELEMLLFDYFKGNISCNYLITKSEELSGKSTDLGQRLYFFEQSEKVSDNTYSALKEDYMRVIVKNWLTLEDIKSLCPANYSTILYFYSNTNCSECENQGYVLDYYKSLLLSDVLIFAIDGDMNMSVVKMLLYNYQIDSFPALVVNGVLYEGYQGTDALNPLLGIY